MQNAPTSEDEILDRIDKTGRSQFRVNAFRFSIYGLILQGVLIYKTFPRFPDHVYLFKAGAVHWLAFLWISILMAFSFLFMAFRRNEKRDFRLYVAVLLLFGLLVLQFLGLPFFR
ncbi:MAG: hypothetical protein AAFV80_17290 [Bacteroidota bacterium]